MGVEQISAIAPTRRFASDADYAECRRIHKQFGTTYFFASRFFPLRLRRKTDAVYAFVRVPDEWVDNPSGTLEEAAQKLEGYRDQLVNGLVEGRSPKEPALRAFCDTVLDTQMPIQEPLVFLDCMAMDLTVLRYPTYPDLQRYMRGSASAIGVMMCHVLCPKVDPDWLPFAMKLGEAMQMTNFIRDMGEDSERGRIYLPLEHLAQFGVPESDLLDRRMTPEVYELVKFEVGFTRQLYAEAKPGIDLLPSSTQKAVRLAHVLYSRILDRVVACDYQVFESRARTSRAEKLIVAGRVVAGLPVD